MATVMSYAFVPSMPGRQAPGMDGVVVGAGVFVGFGVAVDVAVGAGVFFGCGVLVGFGVFVGACVGVAVAACLALCPDGVLLFLFGDKTEIAITIKKNIMIGFKHPLRFWDSASTSITVAFFFLPMVTPFRPVAA